MPTYVKDGGTWRTPTSIFAKVSGVWERVDMIYTKVSGVWVSVFNDQFNLVIATNQTNLNLRSLCVAAGWNQISPVQATVNGGVVISGSTAANDAMVIDGSFPGGLTLTNNGTIVGVAGDGGEGGAGRGDQGSIIDDFGRRGGIAYAGSAGGAGRTALAVYSPVTIFNNGAIAGGGGGGGGGSGTVANQRVTSTVKEETTTILRRQAAAGGGGGGGGRSSSFNSSGGAFGIRVRGSTASIGSGLTITNAQAGGAGDVNAEGAGGLWGQEIDPGDVHARGGSGGSGGFFGATGASGQISQVAVGNLNSINVGGAGGAGGLAIFGNSNITWGATGDRYGGIV